MTQGPKCRELTPIAPFWIATVRASSGNNPRNIGGTVDVREQRRDRFLLAIRNFTFPDENSESFEESRVLRFAAVVSAACMNSSVGSFQCLPMDCAPGRQRNWRTSPSVISHLEHSGDLQRTPSAPQLGFVPRLLPSNALSSFARQGLPEPRAIILRRFGTVAAIPQVDGLHHRYERLAA